MIFVTCVIPYLTIASGDLDDLCNLLFYIWIHWSWWPMWSPTLYPCTMLSRGLMWSPIWSQHPVIFCPMQSPILPLHSVILVTDRISYLTTALWDLGGLYDPLSYPWTLGILVTYRIPYLTPALCDLCDLCDTLLYPCTLRSWWLTESPILPLQTVILVTYVISYFTPAPSDLGDLFDPLFHHLSIFKISL